MKSSNVSEIDFMLYLRKSSVFKKVTIIMAPPKNPIPLSHFARKLHLAMPSMPTAFQALMAQTDMSKIKDF